MQNFLILNLVVRIVTVRLEKVNTKSNINISKVVLTVKKCFFVVFRNTNRLLNLKYGYKHRCDRHISASDV